MKGTLTQGKKILQGVIDSIRPTKNNTDNNIHNLYLGGVHKVDSNDYEFDFRYKRYSLVAAINYDYIDKLYNYKDTSDLDEFVVEARFSGGNRAGDRRVERMLSKYLSGLALKFIKKSGIFKENKMKLENFIGLYSEEKELVKYFSKKDWEDPEKKEEMAKFKGEDCTSCSKFLKSGTEVADIKGKLYHKECYDKMFNNTPGYVSVPEEEDDD